MKINMKDCEDWKERARSERAEISKMDFYEACGRIASVAADPENKAIGMLSASMEIVKAYKKLFPEKKEEEPDAEKPAEKTAPSALEKLLFEQTYLAVVQYAAVSSSEAYSGFKALHGLVIDAGLEEKYNFWKMANGYE
jgi:hypothetical protein